GLPTIHLPQEQQLLFETRGRPTAAYRNLAIVSVARVVLSTEIRLHAAAADLLLSLLPRPRFRDTLRTAQAFRICSQESQQHGHGRFSCECDPVSTAQPIGHCLAEGGN